MKHLPYAPLVHPYAFKNALADFAVRHLGVALLLT